MAVRARVFFAGPLLPFEYPETDDLVDSCVAGLDVRGALSGCPIPRERGRRKWPWPRLVDGLEFKGIEVR